MAKTNFSGPITTGPIQVNTGTTIGSNVRDAAWVKNTMSFPFTYAQFAVTTDANRLAITGSNGAGTTDVTFVSDAVKANVSGITAVGGFQSASCITLNSGGNDSALTATITGTDVLGNVISEGITMGNAGSVTSVNTYQTLTSITVSGAGTVGTLEVGVLLTARVSVACRSLFNANPLSQTSSSTDKNLANNIVIPAWSRITDIELIVTTAFDTAGFDMQIGSNVAQAAGSLTNSFDHDYFAGDDDNDVKAVGNHHIPLYFDQSAAQMQNCLNVSDDDASGYEMDKVVVMSAITDDVITAGNAVLNVEWLQKINDTN